MDFEALFNGMGFAVLYTAVALICGGALIALLLYRFRRERLKDFGKIFLGVASGVAIAATVLLTYLKFCEINAGDGSPDALFKPILSVICIALIGGCLIGVCALFNRFAVKVAGAVTAAGLLGAFIAAMVMMTRYYNDEIVPGGEHPSLNSTAMAIAVAIALAIMVAAFCFGKKKGFNDTKSIVYGAVSIAMSFALSYVRLFKLPQDGSVTFASLLPLMIYCAMFGTRRGLIVCLIYGFLQALQDPYIIHPLQFLLDYPIAFGMIGVSGIFFERTPLKKHPLFAFVAGATLAVLLRYASHVCSGVFAFADYANLKKYDTALAYSFGYNSFALVDLAIDIAAGVFLFASKAFRNQMTLAAQTARGAADDTDYDETVADDGNTVSGK